ncbi:hypothetical protein HDV00_004594 [Rhizophlyctis rosea]|nr:hypothetical protein HDV00_004594 [Rhizophlyctis rosea]
MAGQGSLDPQDYLVDYLQSVENLAPEMNHIFTELAEKENEFQNVRKQATGQHLSLHRHHHSHSNNNNNTPTTPQPKPHYLPGSVPREEIDAVRGIRKAYGRAGQVAGEKLDIANKALALLEAHLKRLDADISSMGIDLKAEGSGGVGGSGSADVRYRGERGRKKRRRVEKTTESDSDVDVEYGDEDTATYCFCQDVSYGDMIACDSPSCPYEWFHYDCVGLTEPPKGKWFCSYCLGHGRAGRKRRMDEGGR